MNLKLYGVMGSVLGGHSSLGRNTTCLVISEGDNELVIDSGTGILSYMRNTQSSKFNIFFTHYHLDHIMGFPFIPQLFNSSIEFNLFGPTLKGNEVESTLKKFFIEPYIPIQWSILKARFNFTNLENKFERNIDGFKVKGLMVDHPGGCMVYSIMFNNKKITILTDLADSMKDNEDVISFSCNSDLIYVDSFFTNKELEDPKLVTFGHASAESAIEIFKKSNSKKLVIGHHKITRQIKDLEEFKTENIIIGVENESFEV